MRSRLLAGLILGGLLALPGAGAAVAASPAAAGYALSGDANAAAVEITMLAATFSTTPLVDGQFPHAQADVASSDQSTAHGSVLDPGALVQTLPYEVSSNCPPPSPFPSVAPPGGCPQFPAWPFGADADSAHPHVTGNVAGQSVGPFSFGAGDYDLVAGAGSASATATGGRASLTAAQPLTVASGSAQASVRLEGATVVSQVTDRLQGVTIAGVVDIGSIDSTATTRAVPGSPGSATGSLAVGDVTVAGQPAAIDQNGIHLLGQDVPLPLDPAEQALQQLQQAGLSIRLLKPEQVAAVGHAAYTGSAIQVTETSPQDGSGFSILLGPARASAVAVPFQAFVPASFPLGAVGGGGTPVLASLPASTGQPPAPPAAHPGGSMFRVAGLALTPKALLLALLGLLELCLLAAGAVVLWPRTQAPPTATLRPL